METPAERRLEAATHAINAYQHQHPYANLQGVGTEYAGKGPRLAILAGQGRSEVSSVGAVKVWLSES